MAYLGQVFLERSGIDHHHVITRLDLAGVEQAGQGSNTGAALGADPPLGIPPGAPGIARNCLFTDRDGRATTFADDIEYFKMADTTGYVKPVREGCARFTLRGETLVILSML